MKMFSINVLLSRPTLNLILVLEFQSSLDDDFDDSSGDYHTGQCLDVHYHHNDGENEDDVKADYHTR